MPRVQPDFHRALKRLLLTSEGALGYLRALPVLFRPDKRWLEPLEESISCIKRYMKGL